MVFFENKEVILQVDLVLSLPSEGVLNISNAFSLVEMLFSTFSSFCLDFLDLAMFWSRVISSSSPNSLSFFISHFYNKTFISCCNWTILLLFYSDYFDIILNRRSRRVYYETFSDLRTARPKLMLWMLKEGRVLSFCILCLNYTFYGEWASSRKAETRVVLVG